MQRMEAMLALLSCPAEVTHCLRKKYSTPLSGA
jgi:hypothetical protein